MFDGVFNYSQKDLSCQFVDKYKDILNMSRGGGYWLWKVDIIGQILKKINDNDILLYMDSGSTFNFRGKEKFEEYCSELNLCIWSSQLFFNFYRKTLDY